MKTILTAFVASLALAAPAIADLVTKPSPKGVGETMDALEAAVTGAGATVFARVDHAAGAESVGMELPSSQLLIFGNPKLGTPAMQADPLAGLYLPLKVLVYADGSGATQVTYEAPTEMLGGLDIPADAQFLKVMTGALDKLTGAAVGG
ncbi:MAG: DUF302 domain-containing protein [Planctomycetota bacterium]